MAVFDRSADNRAGKRLHDNDRLSLAKTISGFGNSEGGVIVWGVDCRRESGAGDVAAAKVPIQNPKRSVSWLEGVVSGCTIPSHPRVQHHAIQMPEPTEGFVVTYIPKSYLMPHQCINPVYYYIRGGSDFVPAPHGVLARLVFSAALRSPSYFTCGQSPLRDWFVNPREKLQRTFS